MIFSGMSISLHCQLFLIAVKNTSGDKIWREYIDIKNNGQFSTLIIAAWFGWDDSGTYVLKAQHNELENKIKFSFSA